MEDYNSRSNNRRTPELEFKVWRVCSINHIPTSGNLYIYKAQAHLIIPVVRISIAYSTCTVHFSHSLLPDPAKVASLNRFSSMLESLFEQEDQLCSDGNWTGSLAIWSPPVHVILMLDSKMHMEIHIHHYHTDWYSDQVACRFKLEAPNNVHLSWVLLQCCSFHPDYLFSRQLVVQLVSDIAKLKQQGILNEVGHALFSDLAIHSIGTEVGPVCQRPLYIPDMFQNYVL